MPAGWAWCSGLDSRGLIRLLWVPAQGRVVVVFLADVLAYPGRVLLAVSVLPMACVTFPGGGEAVSYHLFPTSLGNNRAYDRKTTPAVSYLNYYICTVLLFGSGNWEKP